MSYKKIKQILKEQGLEKLQQCKIRCNSIKETSQNINNTGVKPRKRLRKGRLCNEITFFKDISVFCY